METLQIVWYFFLLCLRWIPRILCIMFAIFVTMFSFDVFGEDAGFWKTLMAFVIHNIPTMILVFLLVLSWKWSWIGGVGYLSLGFVYMFWISGDTKYPILYYPVFIAGVLFLLDWVLRKQIEKAREAYWG